MLKTITAKFLTHESKFGDVVFSNVPVLVESDVDEATFDSEKDEFGVSGDVIIQMEREAASRWLRNFLRHDEDGNHIRRWTLTADEAYGLCLLFEVNATEFGDVLLVNKGTISKAFKGKLFIHGATARLCTMLLERELAKPGYVKGLVKESRRERKPEPVADFQSLKKRA